MVEECFNLGLVTDWGLKNFRVLLINLPIWKAVCKFFYEEIVVEPGATSALFFIRYVNDQKPVLIK